MRSAILILFSFIFGTEILAQNSPLANGQWVKMNFEERGVYSISFNKLNEMGFEASNVDPSTIQIFGLPGGMLPQKNDADWPASITEIPVETSLQAAGQFQNGDKIYFYVDMVDRLSYNEAHDMLQVEKNLYAEHVSYFLTVGQSDQRPIETAIDLGTGFTQFDWHHELIWHEEDLTNLLTSGREWFGERITNNPLNFSHSVSSLASPSAKVHLQMISQAFEPTSMNLNIENKNAQLNFTAIPNQQYGIKANEQELRLPFDIEGDNIDLTLTYDRNGSSNAVSYLNRYSIEVKKSNEFTGDFLLINTESTDHSTSEFVIESDKQIAIWNITDVRSPKSQAFRQSNNLISFSTFTDELQSFWVFDPENTPEPQNFVSLANQNLLGENTPDLIIVTHSLFEDHAQAMANFRRTNDQMNVLVATIEQVYNEFSSGREDVSAIRNFARVKYQQSSKLKYLLLLGKGSYDFKDRIANNSNFVPTYESRNSIHPLFSFSSDDYFGFLEEGEGEWIENRSGDHDLEIGIGRIPVTSIEQADHYLEKWLSYQTDEKTFGEWRSKVSFVADDGDGNIHQRDADILARTVDADQPNFEIEKLYLDAFIQESLPNGEASPEAEVALLTAVHDGRLLINFTGHGAESGWMAERILTFENMEQWNNPYRLPFLVTATCEFGRNDDPATFSGAEFLLTKQQSGAIGLVTTARPVFSSTNFSLNEALYDVMLASENGDFNRLGDIIQYTKNNSLEGSLNRNFILLGDPSMKLAFPESEIVVEEINGNTISDRDTLKAFEEVVFAGRIDGQPNFQGILQYEFIDKAQQKTTLGTESDAFSFTEKDQVLVRGTAQVLNGTFEFTLSVPQNIDYNYGKARLQMYATNNTNANDAFGTYEDFFLGGTDESVQTDNELPEGELFINDTTGNLLNNYPSDVKLIAILEDESGINISENGLGQNIELTINDSASFILNDHFITFPGQYQRGILDFEIKNLPKGSNNFTLSYWDTRGNRNISNIQLSVEENSSLINEIKNYPNPLENETNFYISHQLSGEFLDVRIRIFDLKGQIITELDEQFGNASPELTLTWYIENDLGSQLEKGVYIYDIQISSRTSGLNESKANRLIISY